MPNTKGVFGIYFDEMMEFFLKLLQCREKKNKRHFDIIPNK